MPEAILTFPDKKSAAIYGLASKCLLVGKADDEHSVIPWFYSDFVVDGILNPLFATEISFGGLNRNVTKQKLDLFQFASGGVKHYMMYISLTENPRFMRAKSTILLGRAAFARHLEDSFTAG